MNEEELQKLLTKANEVLQQGDKDKAISLYEEIVTKDPNNAEAHMRLADLYSEKGMKDKASHELLLLGNAYYESRLFKNALKYFQRVLEFDSTHIETRIKAAEIYFSEEMEREAKLEYLAIAEYYLAADDLNKADEFAQKAIELKSIEAHYIMGLVNFKRGMFKEAAYSLETLTKIKVNHVDALLHLGYAYSNLGKYQEAAAAFARALKADPLSIEALKGLTDSYAKKGSPSEANGWYLKAMDALIKIRDYENAVKFALEFIKDSPLNPEAYVKLSQVCEYKNLKDEAVKNLRIAGDLYVKQKAETKAKECYDKAALLIQPGAVPAEPKTTSVPAGVSIHQEDLIERTVAVSSGRPKISTASKKDQVEESEQGKQAAANKEEAISKFELAPAVSGQSTQFVEAKGEIADLFEEARKYMKDHYYEKAIEIYRLILKKESRNITVRQKLHQAYLLLAQQEEEKGHEPVSVVPGKVAPKEKKNKISYL